MEKKIILFAVNTEFVLSIALLYYENHREKEGFYPVWFILKGNNNRFKGLNLDELPGDKFEFWNNLNTRALKPELSFLKLLKSYKVQEFVHQNSLNVSNLLIENKIKKINPNVTKTYISDSIALSVETRRRTIKVANIYLLYRKFLNGVYYLPNRLLKPKEYIKGVDNYINIGPIKTTNAKFYSFKELLTSTSKSKYLSLIFDYSLQEDFDIILFTQPILDHSSFSLDIKNKYINTIQSIIKLAELYQKKVLIKVHPGENSERYKMYLGRYCKIYENNNIPAELLFTIFSNKKVLSCFSSISTLDFLNLNTHFWFYPMINHIPKFNIDTSHITIIKDEKSLIKQFK